MSEAVKPFPLNIKLDRSKDRDIIEYLDDKPSAYIVRLAIRRFMNDENGLLSPEPKKKEESAQGGDLLTF